MLNELLIVASLALTLGSAVTTGVPHITLTALNLLTLLLLLAQHVFGEEGKRISLSVVTKGQTKDGTYACPTGECSEGHYAHTLCRAKGVL